MVKKKHTTRTINQTPDDMLMLLYYNKDINTLTIYNNVLYIYILIVNLHIYNYNNTLISIYHDSVFKGLI